MEVQVGWFFSDPESAFLLSKRGGGKVGLLVILDLFVFFCGDIFYGLGSYHGDSSPSFTTICENIFLELFPNIEESQIHG